MFTYVFGVRSEMNKNMDSIMTLDFFIEYDDDDVSRVNMAQEQIKNEMWESTVLEALQAWDENNIVHQLRMAKLITNANNLSVHKFSSEEKWERDSVSHFVNMSNHCHETKKLLIKGRIRL